ncbi:MAG: ComF family protein [candidate division Zixibacteria bacterium]
MGNVSAGVFKYIKQISNGLVDLIYPPVCCICNGKADSDDRLICVRCWDVIQGFDAAYCSQCRSFLKHGTMCRDCGSESITVSSLGYFESQLRDVIHYLKFENLKPLAKKIGEKLGEKLIEHDYIKKIDLIVPVPLHQSRHYARGFNQAEEIARAISLKTDLPVHSELLYTTRKTRQQAKLHGHERETNVRGAFAVDDSDGILKQKIILLVDDVTTSGATLRENDRVLKEASARRIIAAVAATAV